MRTQCTQCRIIPARFAMLCQNPQCRVYCCKYTGKPQKCMFQCKAPRTGPSMIVPDYCRKWFCRICFLRHDCDAGIILTPYTPAPKPPPAKAPAKAAPRSLLDQLMTRVSPAPVASPREERLVFSRADGAVHAEDEEDEESLASGLPSLQQEGEHGHAPSDNRKYSLAEAVSIMIHWLMWFWLCCMLNPVFRLCLLYTSPSPRDGNVSRMPSSA